MKKFGRLNFLSKTNYYLIYNSQAFAFNFSQASTFKKTTMEGHLFSWYTSHLKCLSEWLESSIILIFRPKLASILNDYMPLLFLKIMLSFRIDVKLVAGLKLNNLLFFVTVIVAIILLFWKFMFLMIFVHQ